LAQQDPFPTFTAYARTALKARFWFPLFFLMSSLSFGQSTDENRAYGVGLIYDFQTNGIGFGARAYLPLTERLAVSPQFAWFPPFNTIHEYYIGLSGQYKVYQMTSWHFYALAAVYYNNWQNSNDYVGKVAKPNNIAGEGGVGLMRTYGCLKPFFEARYDVKWKEAHIHAGIMISFGDCFLPHLCPAYGKPF
jgi:hypothetical protein